jgi:hypothetical protein
MSSLRPATPTAVALFDPELMDVAILDIRMPPTHTDEGACGRRHPASTSTSGA